MIIHCPHCGMQLDVQENLQGRSVLCPGCSKAFTAPVSSVNANNVVYPAVNGASQKPKIPGITIAGTIILYILIALGLIGTLSSMKGLGTSEIFSLGFSVLLLGLVLGINFGKNWARITLTVFTAIIGLLWVASASSTVAILRQHGVDPTNFLTVSVVSLLVIVIPQVFFYLPQSNAWFRAVAKYNKMMGR